ncbi:glycosyltransferase family 4 protein [Aquihabitans sp. McL0605]|uniref:glycosyltransferase family 4 protein n=1 Tax=Aquihabitans sp. McL0605 TaxID=3415671 RepID=UPI003CF67C59
MTTPSAPHLLTVLHAAELTGPPLFALQFLRWLREEEPAWQLSTLFLDGDGPISASFGELGPVTHADHRIPHRASRSVAGRAVAARRVRDLRRELGRQGPIALSHVHCAGSFRAVAALPRGPVLGHLHELSVGLDLHLGPAARDQIPAITRFVAVSDGVRSAFLERFDVRPDLVERQWGFVDPARLPGTTDRAALGLPPDKVIVTSSGVRHWRKAPELFVRVARRAREIAPEVPWQFVWIGGADRGGLEGLVAAAGLDDLVRFLPHQPDALAWIAASDLFVLSAREDAFPLVCVEAAAAGCPIATFDNGGAAELVRAAGCGTVAPALDVEALASQVAAAGRDQAERARWGDAGRRFARQHLLIEQAGPRLLASLRSTLASPA